MAEKFLFEKWKERLHACEDFSSEAKCDEFTSLVAEAENNLTYEVVVELIKTFSDADDFGVQERTRNLVESATREIYYPALVRELGGLIERSPEKQWALTLVGIEVEYGDFEVLLDYVNQAPEKLQDVFFSFVGSDDFLSEYPDVSKYLGGGGRVE
ncbi:hypothetical protein [Burkholderia gladioli]|uniref:hypothetical protein n=1 Tax=Burkholderia gladioli TaxID=28095 RepID=UPI0009C02A4E|nr:hypothetical protein [Burkholderia gladioli]